ncbi:MAG: putative Ig domain-containing protein, partial [Candidatus Omnitrophica bacterium]|nr:putative Ig domain-containing protein [Candidatus Omnitrophota bacterium]
AANPVNPAIDGDRLVWQDLRNGNWDVYLYDLTTQTERRITSHAANQVNPAIDGDRLVWQDLRNGNWDVYLYDLTTQTERRITSHSADQINPAISSHRLVWQDTRNGNWDIYLYDLRQLPVLDPISDWTIPEGQWLTFAVSASDPGGDPLTLSATGLPWGADFPVATGAGNVSGTFHWTPTFEQSGTYQVTFLVSAGNTEVVKTATLTVENVNGAPTLDPLGDQTVREGTLLQVTVGASDPEGDVLTYSASPLPSGASFDVTGGILSWTPDATQAGPYPVTVMATDPRGLRDSTMITITVLDNPPPSLRLLDPDVDDNGVVTILDVLAVAGAFGSHEPRYDLTGDGIVNIFDILLAAGAFGLRWAPTSLPEGQLLRFYVTATDPQGDPLTYSATALPAGASFNPTTREFLWRPGYAQAGSYTVSFTASDGSQSDTQNLPITVTNLGLAIASLTDSPDPFSPSLGQTTTIAATFNQPVTSWTLEIRGPQPATTLQRSFAYSGAATTTLSQLWDGRTSAGLLVPTGTYPYTLTATAAAGSNGGSATRGGTVTVQ